MAAAYAGPKNARRFYYRCSQKCTSAYVRIEPVKKALEPLVFARLGELREHIAAGEETKRAKVPVADFEARRAKVQRRRERFIEAFADELMTRDELSSKLAKLDAERMKVDAEETVAKAPALLADAGVRRFVRLRTWRRRGSTRPPRSGARS